MSCSCVLCSGYECGAAPTGQCVMCFTCLCDVCREIHEGDCYEGTLSL